MDNQLINQEEINKKLQSLQQAKPVKDILQQSGIRLEQRVDKSLLILLDVSGSMSGLMENISKLDLSWKVLKNDLAPNMAGWDYGIIKFSDGARFEISPTPDTSAIITSRSPYVEGGTDLTAGLELAWNWIGLYSKQARIILLTDGEPTDNPKEIILAKAKDHSTIPIDTIGVGKGTYGYDPAFLAELSRITGGVFSEADTVKLLSNIIKYLSPVNRPLLGPAK